MTLCINRELRAETRVKWTERMQKPTLRTRRIALASLVAMIVTALGSPAAAAPAAASRPTKPKVGSPKQRPTNLGLWLRGAARTGPATQPAASAEQSGVDPFRPATGFRRNDAVPGVLQLSDGRLVAGGIYTTREKPLLLFVEAEKRWRRIPLLTVLSISAVVVEEKIVLRWRWKAMGEPERVYTGKKYPTRRLKWTFHLIDDTTLTGTIKGQPLWMESEGRRRGPFILHERSKGKDGQSLKDLVYVKRAFVSRRLMNIVRKARRKALGKGK